MKLCLALGILSFAVLANAGGSMHDPFYCFADDRTKPQAQMLSVVTSYEAVRPIDFSTVNPLASRGPVSTRTPSRFWYLGRYGIRLPFVTTIETMINFTQSITPEIVRNYEAGLTTLCQRDYENIRDFAPEPDFVVENGALVRPSGILEMQNIAQRLQETFPEILERPYSRSQYLFRHVDIARSNQSIRAFASGLFGEADAANVVYEPIPEVDWFLRPFENCELITYDDHDDYEELAFTNGPEVRQMIREINEKLGFRVTNRLDISQINTMWQWCRFQLTNTFATGIFSPWCAPFSIAHQQILVYIEDVQYHYRTGYGLRNRRQRLQENVVCGIVQDLVSHMRSDNDTDQKARILFSFLSEMQATLVALGTFRDVWEINQFNFAQQGNRQWLTSLILNFGAHIAVVRYDSEDGDHDLVFQVNEKPILVPGCDVQTGICKLSFIEDRFERFIHANCPQLFCSYD